jgi:hypothetical protein
MTIISGKLKNIVGNNGGFGRGDVEKEGDALHNVFTKGKTPDTLVTMMLSAATW